MDNLTGRILEKLGALSANEKRKKKDLEFERIQSAIRKSREEKKKAQFKMRVTEKFNADFDATSKKLGLSKTQIAEETLKEVFHFLGVKHPRK